jgi:hypothetical protein
VLLAATAAAAVNLPAAPAPASSPIHRLGSHGPKVAKLQDLLGGRAGYVFTAVKPTFTHPANGLFGARTAAAVTAMKWRLGYPKPLVRPIAGTFLFALLEGTKTRPAFWVALAASRLRAVEVVKPTAIALKIKAYEISQLGVLEIPLGSNNGPQVRIYQADTGAFGEAWCVSFQQHSFRVGGYGHFADDTASVYHAVDYFAARSELHAKPKVGALVLFVDYDAAGQRIPGTGHAGYVVRVGASWYVSVEGNQANGVHEVFHHLGDRGNVFAELPGVA